MIVLNHLTFVGANVEPSTIRFGPRLTLVRGPSDTGKSFVVDAIDFMFGAKELKEIPERQGYSSVLLGISVADTDFTLHRSVTGGAFELYEGLLYTRPTAPPDRTLSHVHNAASQENLSMWLLGTLGLAGARLRRNLRNDTDSLSFRDLAHLVIVDETQMQSEVPPALSGRAISKTKEVSLLKLLLEGDDDSTLIASPLARDARRLKGARLEVVDQLIINLEERLRGQPDFESLGNQLARLNQSIDSNAASTQQLTDLRGETGDSLQRDQTRRRASGMRLSQIASLRARFGLLKQQYELDVARLELIVEGGTFLGYFESAACPLCGAEQAHQRHDNFDADATSLVAAAGAEQHRTELLLMDLEETLQDLDQSEESLVGLAAQADSRIAEHQARLRSLEQQLQPNRSQLSEYLRVKSGLEASLALFAQLNELTSLRAQIEDEVVAEAAATATAIGAHAVDALSRLLSDRLVAWGYEAAVGARYDRAQQDIFADHQFRSAHGKGVRAILHAAFTIALAEYCLESELPHPGFVVLDSPLITYRAPGEPEEAGPNRTFGTRFYHDLEQTFVGQVIVMENTDPLDELDSTTTDIVFTKLRGVGRYGYFPPIADSSERALELEG